MGRGVWGIGLEMFLVFTKQLVDSKISSLATLFVSFHNFPLCAILKVQTWTCPARAARAFLTRHTSASQHLCAAWVMTMGTACFGNAAGHGRG